MPTLYAFLVSIAGTLTGRVLLALGIGMVSYAGLNVITANVISQISASYNSAPGFVLNLLNLAGAGHALGILTSALVTRTSLIAIKKLRAI